MVRSHGFTIIEMLVALVVFAFGVLGLAAESAALTRLLARARRAAQVTAWASARLERLRAGACTARADGTETLSRGSATLATLQWTWSDGTDSTYRVLVVANPGLPAGPRARAETLGAVFTCRQ
jgi:prepilin-type N-terminal cleavage/methylation domain-containing protein